MAEQAHNITTPGTMDIRAQEKTFAGFIKLVQWSLVAIVIVLIFMALANS